MGPEADMPGAGPLPAQLRFSSAIRTVPWTDAVGDQLLHTKPVYWCSSFHEKFDDRSGNKIKSATRSLSLLSNLYVRAEHYVAT